LMSGEKEGGRRILSLTEHLVPTKGGAEISLLNILHHLSARHDVRAHCTGQRDVQTTEGGIPVHVHGLDRPLNRVLRATRMHWIDLSSRDNAFARLALWAVNDLKPDLVLTQLNFTGGAVSAAGEAGVPSVVFLRSPEFICPMGLTTRPSTECTGDWKECLPFGARIQYRWLAGWMAGVQSAILAADLVVANSQWMADLAHRHLGIEAHVIHPPVDADEVRPSGWKPSYVLYMGQLSHKGLDTFLNVAHALPDHRFVVCGKQDAAGLRLIEEVTNVEYWGWTLRKRAYAGARLVLVPSTWEEPFGRVPVEAGTLGIPSIATGTGGLPEAVGEGGILLPDARDSDAWVEATRRLLEDEEEWSRLSVAAREHARAFEPGKVLADLDRLLDPLLEK
jgi:glycosyltransferase involved in cell wall biosynthesis